MNKPCKIKFNRINTFKFKQRLLKKKIQCALKIKGIKKAFTCKKQFQRDNSTTVKPLQAPRFQGDKQLWKICMPLARGRA